MIGKLFNAAVDIVSIPAKLTGKIADDVIDSDIESYVDEIKDTIKIITLVTQISVQSFFSL